MSRADNWTDSDLSQFVDKKEDTESEADTRPPWEPQQGSEPDTGSTVRCTCGNRPTKQFARVFGDNSDQVDRCPECATYRELKDGGAARGELK